MSLLYAREELYAICPRCFIISVSFGVSGRCSNCAFKEKRPPPLPYIERKRTANEEKK